ncbi:MAG: hypothetical protein J6A89_01675 [Clostridia bacterium]|nr:hypothetical protein [Clostridia bacterium]
MKRKIKIKVLLISCIATLLTACFCNTAFAESTTIQYDGSISYQGSTVGNFHVDGRRAFCMDHEKTSPSNGTTAETSIYTDENVIKCLYYGWEGAEVWSGFNGNRNYGIVATTLALDHYVNGSNKTVARDFIAFIDSAPKPEESLNFSENNLKATIQGDKQVTNQIKITGTTGISLKFSIPNDITIICDNNNWSQTGGTVELRDGDTIHFEAPITKTGNWTSEQIPNSYVYNAILSKTSNESLQRVVRLGKKDPGTYTNISIKFEDTGAVEIQKKDSQTGAVIPNTTFDVKNSSGEVVGQINTDSNGKGTLSKLIAGTYTLVETKANNEYVLDSNPIQVNITAGTTTTKEITNNKKRGGIKVLKVDKDNHKVTLGNVGFKLYSEEFKAYLKQNNNSYERVSEENATIFYTNVNGEVTINNLRYGNYKLKEVETNDWYSLAGDTSFTIDKTEILNLTIENELKSGSIKVIKVDKDNNEVKLKDVKFDVYVDRNNNGVAERNEYVDTLITDENGEATTSKYTIRDYGHLILVETETQEGYVLDNTPKTVVLKENQITTIIFENEAKKGKGKIIKTDEYDNTKVIAGAVFEVYEDVNKNGTIEKGIDKLVDTLTTGKDGTAISKDLRIDRNYLYIEIKAPEGYILDNTVRIFELEYNKTIDHNIVNRPKTIQIEVIKTDSEDKTIKVPNVEFTIYEDTNRNGKIDDEDKIIDTITTDEHGRAISKSIDTEDKSKVLRVENQYIIKETKHNIAYNEENIEQVLDFTKYLKDGEYKENLVVTLNIENKPITTKVNPHKEDRDTHKPLAGAEFDIYEDTNGNDKLDEEDKVIFHTVTKEDGYSEDLTFRYGTYFVKETKAPEGYTLDHVISTFKVVSQDQKIEINFADKIIENDVNILKKANNDSIKYDIKKDEGVPDTYFALYKIDEDGNIIDFAKDKFDNYIGEKIVIDGKEYYTVKTDKTGNVSVTVPYGKYLFKEIKTHDLFLNDSKDNIIDVLDDGKQVTLEFFNTAVNLELDISKTGINQAQPNDIIRYDFPNLINKSNVALDNFTWWDHLPSKYTKITKLYTGTWNEDLTFKVYYKTNRQDYTQYGLEYSTLINNCIDFESLGLDNEDDEYITDFKIVFGTVKSGFSFIEAPFIFTKVDSDIKASDEWTNKTKITGQYTDVNGNIVELEDNDEHTTTTYGKELKITTLPRTGNDGNMIHSIKLILIFILIIIGMVFIRYKK